MNAVINVKINSSERDEYSKVCKKDDTTMSQDIRKFIRSRIENSKKNK